MKTGTLIWIAGGIAFILLFSFFNPEQYIFPKCPFRAMTGFLCPGCGSQRAIYHALHGNFSDAFRLNYLFFPALVYGSIGLATERWLPSYWPDVQRKFYGLKAAYIALGVVVMFWIVRNLF